MSVLYYGLILPKFSYEGLDSVFNQIQYPVFVLITLIITGSAYIINDIFDIQTDKINKPEKAIIGNSISIKNAYRFYLILLFIGFLLSLWIAISINKFHYILLYVFPVVFLYLYSRFFKKTLLLGNLLVSFFSMGVPAILLIFEYEGLELLRNKNQENYSLLISIFAAYMIFSFMLTLFREIIKDIEDVEGDKNIDANTLPIKMGVEVSKNISGFLAVLIVFLIFYWMKMPVNKALVKIYTIVAVIFPLGYTVWLLKNANKKSDFHKISTLVKIIMLTGIGILFFYL
jgi:4-hydroxybenzoate polyprenyltransferase